MQAVGQNVVVKPFQISNVTEGGLIVPDTLMRPSNKGKIVSVGNGSKAKPMQFKEGDIAYRVKSWGEEIIIDGELHFIMDQKALIATE